jgi:uncharacterized membrane protein
MAKKIKEKTNSSDSDHQMTAVLSYIGILVLIPLLAIDKKKKDDFIKFHIKQGLILFLAEIILAVIEGILARIPVIGWVFETILGLAWLAIVIVCVIAIIKALNGEKWEISMLSDYTKKINI